MKVKLYHKRGVRIEMLPLIDIVFLLLVFFIYAMLSMAVHRGLPVLLPTSSAAKIDRQLVLSVTVRGDGRIFVDQTPTTLETLQELLSTKREDSQEPGVLLFADRDLPYQSLFRVLDQIRHAGISRISLQAEAEQ